MLPTLLVAHKSRHVVFLTARTAVIENTSPSDQSDLRDQCRSVESCKFVSCYVMKRASLAGYSRTLEGATIEDRGQAALPIGHTLSL